MITVVFCPCNTRIPLDSFHSASPMLAFLLARAAFGIRARIPQEQYSPPVAIYSWGTIEHARILHEAISVIYGRC
jgi:hypothetical protein